MLNLYAHLLSPKKIFYHHPAHPLSKTSFTQFTLAKIIRTQCKKSCTRESTKEGMENFRFSNLLMVQPSDIFLFFMWLEYIINFFLLYENFFHSYNFPFFNNKLMNRRNFFLIKWNRVNKCWIFKWVAKKVLDRRIINFLITYKWSQMDENITQHNIQ